MPDAISSEIREQLEALCRKVSVSYDLNPGIRKELYGHMEDRLLAHMNGETPLTEQDAFELVSKQFGDPAVIQELFQGVYLKEMTASMGRRMVAALVAFTAVGLLYKVLFVSAAMFPSLFGSWGEPHQIWFIIMFNVVVVPGIMYLILLTWKTRIERGERVWFQAWSTERIILVYFAVIVILCPTIDLCSRWFPVLQFNPPNDVLGRFLNGFFALGFVIMGILWMWFCDQPPRPRDSIHWAVSGFAFMFFVPTMITNAINNWTMLNLDHSLVEVSTFLFISFIVAEIILILYWVVVGLCHLTKRFRPNSDDPFRTA